MPSLQGGIAVVQVSAANADEHDVGAADGLLLGLVAAGDLVAQLGSGQALLFPVVYVDIHAETALHEVAITADPPGR